MSTWAKKIEENWFLEILHKKGFKEEKKLSKNLYIFSYVVESIDIPILVYICVDKTLNLTKVKQIVLEILPFFHQSSYQLFISPDSLTDDIKIFLNKLNISFTDTSQLLISLFPFKNYMSYIKDNFGNENYMLPWLYLQNTKLDVQQFIQKIKKNKEGSLLLVEGDKGIGKTQFNYFILSFLTSSLDQYKKEPDWVIPFYISMQSFNGETSIKKYIEYQIFNPDIMISLDYNNFLLLLKHHKIILIIDAVDKLLDKSFEFLENTLFCIKEYIALGAQVIITTPIDFFFLQMKDKYLLKSYFTNILSDINISSYNLKPLTLFQIKQEYKEQKIQKIIQNNNIIKSISKYPAILRLIKILDLKLLSKIYSLKDFFNIILQNWEEKYLTLLGKETLLEFIAQYTLEHDILYVQDIPLYLENFVVVHHRGESLNFNLLEEELKNCVLLSRQNDGGYYFIHPIIHFYFIKTQLVLEISRGNLKNIYALKHTLLLELLSLQEIQEIIIPNVVKYLETLSFKEKGVLFELFYKIKKYILSDSYLKVDMTSLKLENMSLSDVYLGFSKFIKSNLAYLQAYNIDLRYIEWEKTNLSHSYFKSVCIDYNEYKENVILEANWKFLQGEGVKFTEQKFIHFTLESSYLKTTHIISSLLDTVHLESNIFESIQWGTITLHDSFSTLNTFKNNQFQNSLLKNVVEESNSYLETTFIHTSLLDFKTSYSHYPHTHWKNIIMNNVHAVYNNYSYNYFENCTLENIKFIDCDLREINFISCKLSNIVLENCDTRGIKWDEKTTLCEETKKYFSQNLL